MTKEETKIEESDLLPCPFCGKKADFDLAVWIVGGPYEPSPHWHAKIECSECGMTQGWQVVSKLAAKKANPKLVKEVVAHWNTRAKSGEAEDSSNPPKLN